MHNEHKGTEGNTCTYQEQMKLPEKPKGLRALTSTLCLLLSERLENPKRKWRTNGP